MKLAALDIQPLTRTLQPGPQDDDAVAAIIDRLEKAKAPLIMVDGGAARREWAPHVGGLVDALKVPYFVTLLGKGAVNEQNPLFGGWYCGSGSWDRSIKAVEKADCILWLGNLPSDFNTLVCKRFVPRNYGTVAYIS